MQADLIDEASTKCEFLRIESELSKAIAKKDLQHLDSAIRSAMGIGDDAIPADLQLAISTRAAVQQKVDELHAAMSGNDAQTLGAAIESAMDFGISERCIAQAKACVELGSLFCKLIF